MSDSGKWVDSCAPFFQISHYPAPAEHVLRTHCPASQHSGRSWCKARREFWPLRRSNINQSPAKSLLYYVRVKVDFLSNSIRTLAVDDALRGRVGLMTKFRNYLRPAAVHEMLEKRMLELSRKLPMSSISLSGLWLYCPRRGHRSAAAIEYPYLASFLRTNKCLLSA